MTNDEFLELTEEYNKSYAHYNEVKEKYRNEKMERLFGNFVGKYIKYDFWKDDCYLYVEQQFLSGADKVILRGIGFDFAFTDYIDETYFTWDRMYDIEMNAINPEEHISHIQIIDKETFMNKFSEGMLTAANRMKKELGE